MRPLNFMKQKTLIKMVLTTELHNAKGLHVVKQCSPHFLTLTTTTRYETFEFVEGVPTSPSWHPPSLGDTNRECR